MQGKLKTLVEAAARVTSGAQVVMSANMHGSPMALLRQVVRQGTRDLRVIGVVHGAVNIDFLVDITVTTDENSLETLLAL